MEIALIIYSLDQIFNNSNKRYLICLMRFRKNNCPSFHIDYSDNNFATSNRCDILIQLIINVRIQQLTQPSKSAIKSCCYHRRGTAISFLSAPKDCHGALLLTMI